MADVISTIVLWLFVFTLGTAFGAGVYEARIVVPLWEKSPPDSIGKPDSGRRFWIFVSTIPLTILTLASLGNAWQAYPGRREWWLLAVALVVVERVATFAYFIPTILRLHRSTASAGDIAVGLAQWRQLNYARNTLIFIAWLAGTAAIAAD